MAADDVPPTKLQPPRLHAGIVARNALVTAVNAALSGCKLVLLSAPAGYGKTVALAQALSHLPEGHAVAWVSLAEDDDVPRLLACLAHALEPFDLPWRISPLALPSCVLREDGMRVVVDMLATALEQAEAERGVLALDDMHRIGDPRVFEFLDRLLRILPRKWTIAMTCRVHPPLPLSRMLVSGELTEFGQEQLRFARADVESLLQINQQPRDAEEVDQLLERTQGWPVGLSLEVLAPAVAPRASVVPPQRRMFEYLAQEVLSQLPQAMQGFLLRCSILPDLTVERCAHLTGDLRAAHWLDELLRRDLFVSVLDDDVLTLRLHDLFREFLERQLAQGHSHELPELLQKASQGETDLVARVGYLLRAGAWDEAARQMLQAASRAIHTGGEAQLMGLMQQFPQEHRSLPELAFVQGLCAWHRIDYGELHVSMLRAMNGFERGKQWQRAIQARGLAAVGLYLSGHLAKAYELWDDAPRVELSTETVAVSVLLEFIRTTESGPYESSPVFIRHLVQIVPSIESTQLVTLFRVYYAFFGRWGLRGPLQSLADALLVLAHDTQPQLKIVALRLQAWLTLWRGDVSAALAICNEIAEDARWYGEAPSFVMPNQLLFSLAHHLTGDHASARQIMQDIIDSAERAPGRRSKVMYVNLLGGLAAAAQDWPGVQRALATIEYGCEPVEWQFVHLQTMTLRAELALHRNNPAEAAALLRPLVSRAMDFDHYGVNARLRVALARAELRAGSPATAWEALEPAVRQAMEAGEPLGLLLCGPAALKELALARWAKDTPSASRAYLLDCEERARQLRRSNARAGSFIENDIPLSEREHAVLTLVAKGQSNKQIARELNLSPHTVKRHLARILDKTGKPSRHEAAAWFREHVSEPSSDPN